MYSLEVWFRAFCCVKSHFRKWGRSSAWTSQEKPTQPTELSGAPPIGTTWGCGRWHLWNTGPDVTPDCWFDLDCLQQNIIRILLLLSTWPREQQGTWKLCLYQVQIQLSRFINRHLWEASKNKTTVWPQQPDCVKLLPKMPQFSIIT